MNLAALQSQMVVLFSIILLGFLAMRAGFLPKNTNQVLSSLVINVSNPCAVLASVLGGEKSLANGEVLLLTAVAAGLHGLLILWAMAVPRLLGAPGEERQLYKFMTVFGNISFLGFPLLSALFGPQALFLAAIFVLVFQILCYTYGASLLSRDNAGFQWKRLLTPMIVASTLAYILYLTGVRAPEPVYNILHTAGSLTSPAAMLAIGCALAQQPLRRIFGQWRIYVFSLLRLVAVPVAVWAACFWWMPNELMLGVTVAVAAMPVATNTILMVSQYGGDEGLAASGVFVSTLLSMATLPLIMGWLF